jgi:hypothetical protein
MPDIDRLAEFVYHFSGDAAYDPQRDKKQDDSDSDRDG